MSRLRFIQHMKIGSMPSGYVYVRYARRPPEIGRVYLVRDTTDDPMTPWKEIRVTHYSGSLCFAERR